MVRKAPSSGLAAETPSVRLVSDDSGAAWVKCDHPQCDLHVVQPGKVQCAGYCTTIASNHRDEQATLTILVPLALSLLQEHLTATSSPRDSRVVKAAELLQKVVSEEKVL